MRAGKRGLGFAVVMTVMLVAGFAATPAGSAVRAGTSGADEPWDLQDIRLGRTLISHVPEAIRPSCTMKDLRAPGGDQTVVAEIGCSVPSGDGNYSLSYSQYDSQDSMQAAYDAAVAEPVDVARPDGCTEDDGYTVGDVHTGSYACIPGKYQNSIVYTYEPLLVVATLTDYLDDGFDLDATTLTDYWNNDAGPTSERGSIPKLLSQKEGERLYQDLRSKIPAKIRSSCEPNRNSFTNPYVAVQVECEHPSDGVWLVRYTSYQDDAGMNAAYDEDGFLALRQEQSNDDCPASGTWKVKGAVRGRYACTVDLDNSYLLWTLNKARIVAYAYAQVGDMDTASFLDWWNNEAGPNLN
jgi:hypothetical protein